MKKTILKWAVIAIVFSIAISGMAMADNDELELLSSMTGAEIRFSQLSRSISDSIAIGEIVIDELLKENPDTNISEAQDILEELGLLKDEIEAINYSTTNTTELAELFIMIKQEATSLVKDFRTIINTNTSFDSNDVLKQRIKMTTIERNRGTDIKIKNMITAHNALIIDRIGKNIGTDWKNLSDGVRAGAIETMEAEQLMTENIDNMIPSKRENAQALLLEEKARNLIFAQKSEGYANMNLTGLLQTRSRVRNELMLHPGIMEQNKYNRTNTQIPEDMGNNASDGQSDQPMYQSVSDNYDSGSGQNDGTKPEQDSSKSGSGSTGDTGKEAGSSNTNDAGGGGRI